MAKNVLILGGGTFQLAHVEKVKELGLVAHVVSYNKNEPGALMADVFHHISTADHGDLEILVEKYRFEAVLAPASDFNVRVAAYLNQKFNFPGVRPELAETLTDKMKFREFLKAEGFPFPRYVVGKTVSDFEDFYEDNIQLILKPLRASGSKGVSKFIDGKALKEFLLGTTLKDSVIVEEYIAGVEYGCEALVVEGEIVFFTLTKKFCNDNLVPYAHICPSGIPVKKEQAVSFQLQRLVHNFKNYSGSLNLDVMISDSGIYLLDAGPRSGGNGLPELVSFYSGVDVVKANIQLALGGIISEIKVNHQKAYASYIFGAKKAGYLKELPDVTSKVKALGGQVISLVYNVAAGDRVFEFSEGSYNLGYMLIEGKSREQLAEIINNLSEQELFEVNDL